jgi:hypothetical protein
MQRIVKKNEFKVISSICFFSLLLIQARCFYARAEDPAAVNASTILQIGFDLCNKNGIYTKSYQQCQPNARPQFVANYINSNSPVPCKRSDFRTYEAKFQLAFCSSFPESSVIERKMKGNCYAANNVLANICSKSTGSKDSYSNLNCLEENAQNFNAVALVNQTMFSEDTSSGPTDQECQSKQQQISGDGTKPSQENTHSDPSRGKPTVDPAK